MNSRSVICNFLAHNPDDWERILTEEYVLRIKRDGDYAIFNYNVNADFFDPIVQEARGIIIDTSTLEVVCWPFRKFGNHTEAYADTIDWESARVLEKVDGSIVKLWYDKREDRWRFSTNKTIDADVAEIEENPGLTFGTLIKRASNYGDIPMGSLNKDNTYIFELVSPEKRIVIKYPYTLLYHIGTRNNVTGEEMNVDIGIIKPEEYPLGSLEDCIKAAAALNSLIDSDEIVKEGFVVVDKNWHRVKVKSLDYISLHHVSTYTTPSKKKCLQLLLTERHKIDIFCKEAASLEHIIKFYDYKLSELLYYADQMGKFARNLFEEYSHDRRAVAQIILNHRLSFVGFRCIESGCSGRDVILSLPIEKIAALLSDYAPNDALECSKKSDT